MAGLGGAVHLIDRNAVLLFPALIDLGGQHIAAAVAVLQGG